MIRSYRQLDMQNLEIINMTLEKLDVEPVSPGEGRIWFSNEISLPYIRANGQNRFLVAPDDDFNFTLPLKETLYINDTILIYDIENQEYRRIKASVILDKMSTVKDVFKTMHTEYGVKNIVAKDDDDIYFTADGILLRTVGDITGTKSIKYDLNEQAINSVFAGPLDVTIAKPTFRHLTDGDLPASYNPSKWNEAVNFANITEGNPTNVTMLDLGYIVVTTIGTPGLDENLPTEKAVRVAIGLAIAALIDSSPGLLDTLNEIAAALGDDPNFATTITNLITGKEPGLGNPSVSGYFLSSTTSGVRSWINVPDPFVTSVVSDILSATALSGVLSVVPYALVNKDDGRFYWGTTDPTNAKRLNYDGYFYATNLYSSYSYIGAPVSNFMFLTPNLLDIYVGGNIRSMLYPGVSNLSTSIPYVFDTSNILNVAGSKLVSIKNHGTEKFYIDPDGNAYANGVLLTGSAGVVYNNATTTPTTLGGIAAGSTFVDQTMQQMWDSFLYPYQAPIFTNFYISAQVAILECGVYMDTDSKMFYWTTSNPGNIQANSIAIYDFTNSSPLATGLLNDGSEVISCGSIIKYNTTEQQIYRISGTNSKSQAMSSIYSITTWYSPFYYGVGTAALSVSAIQALTKQVVSKSNKVYSFSPTSQKFYFAYPASYGYLTSIMDPNGFPIISSFTVSTKSFTYNTPNYKGNTVSYYVYESNSLTTQTGFVITFNF